MQLVRLAHFVFGLASLTLTSCSNWQGHLQNSTSSNAHLERRKGSSRVVMSNVTKSKAIELAKEEFVKNGRTAEDYRITVQSRGRKWVVWFDYNGEYPIPGGKNAITVEKGTGKVAFLPGE